MNKLIFNIKKILKPVLRKISNKKIRGVFININDQFNKHTYNSKVILKYFDQFNLKEIDPEKLEVINFLRNNKINLFPYDFIKKYNSSDIKIFDGENGLKYGLSNNKKIFFKRSCSENEAQQILSALNLEQDNESPHRYLNDHFTVDKNDIVLDIGAAEGYFSLSIVEKVNKIYIFESNPELIEALNTTFEPWKYKVFIVNKYVSNKSDEIFTTIDDFFKDKEPPTFLKVDIEGAEYDFMQGAKKLLSTKNQMKIILASYHKHNDEIILNEELKKYGFKTKFSKGYMLSIWDGIIKEPYLRRALIRAQK